MPKPVLSVVSVLFRDQIHLFLDDGKQFLLIFEYALKVGNFPLKLPILGLELSRSKPVRARSRMSTMAWAWTSVSAKRSIKLCFASATLRLSRIYVSLVDVIECNQETL